MNDKSCFIDTNLWLYNLVEEQPNSKTGWHDKPEMVDLLIQQYKTRIYISVQVVNEVLSNLYGKYASLFPEEERKLVVDYFYSSDDIAEVIEMGVAAFLCSKLYPSCICRNSFSWTAYFSGKAASTAKAMAAV